MQADQIGVRHSENARQNFNYHFAGAIKWLQHGALGYDQGPRIAWWWLDGYVDFSREQKPHVKQAIQEWFGWYRSAQLPEYEDWLPEACTRISDPLTSEQVCRWSEELQDIIAPAFDHAVQQRYTDCIKAGKLICVC